MVDSNNEINNSLFPALQYPGSESSYLSFTFRDVPHVALERVTYFPANAEVHIRNDYSRIDAHNLTAFCRAELVVATHGSACKTEAWLPDDWNGRLLGVGNGGFAGGVTVAELGNVAVTQGFAGLSTDTGHYSTPNSEKWAGPGDDVSPAECPYLVGIRWSSGNAIVDWTWRTLHLGVLAGKEVTKQYCGRVPGKAYFMDCSTGQPI
ncbi:hypothetical protein AcW1_008414 [Taiwanofungus camphoratus]|nr:hypothetical protein AcV5_008706 [Antrodia cinnamomea]KAI0951354.1 hypothetical protein AcW1_008414 [Antrodia cinnamomea]KAI0956260.1 hypothetical protein AcV7_006704 [Antrodia cinnamomea]